MTEKSQTPVNATSQPSLNTDKSGLLQRKCECGNSAGLAGICSNCQIPLIKQPKRAADNQVTPVLHELIQPKLTVGAPNDKYEQEADRVAAQIMQMRDPKPPAIASPLPIQSLNPSEIQPEHLHAKAHTEQPLEVSPQIETQLQTHRGGHPLPPETQTFMESRFGHDFSQVRVHRDPEAAQLSQALHAQAFTQGQDIYFAAGCYQPHTESGKHLLAHELTHVVQQSAQPTGPPSLQNQAAPEITPAPSGIQRWATAVPDSQLVFNANADPAIAQIDSDVANFLSPPLSDHKVRTGTLRDDLNEQTRNAPAQIARGEIRIPGSARSQEEREPEETPISTPDTARSDAVPAESRAPAAPESPAAAPNTGEQVRDLIATDQAQAHAMQSQQVSFPSSATSSPEGSGGSSNETQVRQQLSAIDVNSDTPIERPEAPELDLSGEADPAQLEGYSAEFEQQAAVLTDESTAEIARDRGEQDIAPDEPLEDTVFDWTQFQTPDEPEAPEAEDPYQQALDSVGLSSEQYPFTQNVDAISDQLQTGAADLQTQSQQLQDEYSTDINTLQSDTQGEIDGVMQDARQQEVDAHTEAESRVEAARTDWRTEQEQALEDHRAQADQQIADAETQIGQEQERFDREATQAIDTAMQEAQTERDRAEQRAQEERDRAEREAEEGGFWDWVGDALDAVIDAVTTVISAIFDGLNWLINQIFKGLEWVLEQLIEGIRFIVVGILEVTQAALDLLGDALEALFGEQARRWIDAINGFLEDAIDVLNSIFDWIRDALVGILEMINQGLQAIVTLIKWSVTITVMLMTGLWIRYLWLAIENFERLWNNVMGSFDGLLEILVDRSDEALQEFWRTFWTPANQLMIAVGLVIYIAGFFVGISEVITIILLILAVLYLATVAVELGNRFLAYAELIWNDDVAGARIKLADTLLWLALNLPLILLAIFGVRGGLRALRGGRAGGGASERTGAGEGEGTGAGGRTGAGEGERTGTGEQTGTTEPPRRGCFVAGTGVKTPTQTMPIEQLQPGDMAIGWDLRSHACVPVRVHQTSARQVAIVLDIALSGTVITCSPEHPFWVPGQAWVLAKELQAGMPLLSLSHGTLLIETITLRTGSFTVYNLEVDGSHNYCVSPLEILVHNKAMRWMLQDRAVNLKTRVTELLEDVNRLPNDAPNKAELQRQVEAIDPEATRLSERARTADEAALEPERGAIESLEDRLSRLEEAVYNESLPSRARSLPHRLRQAQQRVARLPDTPEKFEMQQRLRDMEQRAQDVSDLAREMPPEEFADLAGSEVESLEYDLRGVEERLPSEAPPPAEEEPAYVRENRPPRAAETILGDETLFERTGNNYQGQQIFRERATGHGHHIDNFHRGAAAEIEYYAGTHEGAAHLGTKTPTGAPLDGPIKGRTLRISR